MLNNFYPNSTMLTPEETQEAQDRRETAGSCPGPLVFHPAQHRTSEAKAVQHCLHSRINNNMPELMFFLYPAPPKKLQVIAQ